MLDYKQLKSKFTKTLNTFDKESLERWVEFDSNRETLTKLLEGETVCLKVEHLSVEKISDPREFAKPTDDPELAFAA